MTGREIELLQRQFKMDAMVTVTNLLGGASFAFRPIRRQYDLCVLRAVQEMTARHRIPLQVVGRDAGAFAEALREQLGDIPIPLPPAQVLVTYRAQRGEGPSLNVDERRIERPAAQVVHQDAIVAPAIRQGGRHRFGQQFHYVEAGPPGRLARSLLLQGGERSRNGDDRPRRPISRFTLGIGKELPQDGGRHILRRVPPAMEFARPLQTHLPLDRIDNQLGMLAGGPFGCRADDAFVRRLEVHYRGGRLAAYGVRDDDALAMIVDVRDA